MDRNAAPTLTEVLSEFTPEERARIERNARAIVAESRTLAQVRKALNVTQADLAKAIDTTQSNVAQIERKDDILVSTLTRVVKGLGGELDLIVRLPRHQQVALKIGASKSGGLTLKKKNTRKRATKRKVITGVTRETPAPDRQKLFG